ESQRPKPTAPASDSFGLGRQDFGDHTRGKDKPSSPAKQPSRNQSESGLRFESSKTGGGLSGARPAKPKQSNAGPKSAPATQETDPDKGLKGTNLSMPVLSVFQFIERMRKSGVMTIKLGNETMAFEFDHGYVQSCQTDKLDKKERLGDLLLERCIGDAGRLRSVLANAAGQSQVRIGEVIVQSGLA